MSEPEPAFGRQLPPSAVRPPGGIFALVDPCQELPVLQENNWSLVVETVGFVLHQATTAEDGELRCHG